MSNGIYILRLIYGNYQMEFGAWTKADWNLFYLGLSDWARLALETITE